MRVHEPLSVIDLLDAGQGTHSWGVGEALEAIQQAGTGVMVLMNCTQDERSSAAADRQARSASTCACTASARRSCATSAWAACA